ncbi:hypothetical protein BCR44DRAFT_1433766 [Catenaria anguillulae PL171]|uniref:Uncharacterized protein n=1 Tax=Catenaria anguillulae PL171 TaxID=765915 RepID=A0A1Y2HLV1_9FUNG|nr:hypothetical protein BCR44DRAFT_1433766 [Catenaria anguillulae PL171]
MRNSSTSNRTGRPRPQPRLLATLTLSAILVLAAALCLVSVSVVNAQQASPSPRPPQPSPSDNPQPQPQPQPSPSPSPTRPNQPNPSPSASASASASPSPSPAPNQPGANRPAPGGTSNNDNNSVDDGPTPVDKSTPALALNAFLGTEKPPSAYGIPYATLAKYKDTMYIIGGMADPINNRGAMSTAFALDLTVPQTALKLNATKVADLPNKAAFGNGCAVVMGNQVMVAGGQFEQQDMQKRNPWFSLSPEGGNAWSVKDGTATVPAYHSTCLPGRENLFQLMQGGVDPQPAKPDTLVSSVVSFTDAGVGSLRDTELPQSFGGSFLPINSTHMLAAGGYGQADKVANSRPAMERAVVSIANGARGEVKPMLVQRVLFSSFVYKNKYVIHVGGNVPGKKTGQGGIVEWYDLATQAWPDTAWQIDNKDKGPEAIYAPSAFLHDNHIFIVGGLVKEVQGINPQPNYLRILKIEEQNGNSLAMSWVDEYKPSPPPLRGPLGLTVWAWVGIGLGGFAVLAMGASGWTLFNNRMRARREEQRVKEKAELDYMTRVQYESTPGPNKTAGSSQAAAAAAAAAAAGGAASPTIYYTNSTTTSPSKGGAYVASHATGASSAGGYYAQPVQAQNTGYQYPQYTGSTASGGGATSPYAQAQQSGGYYQQPPASPYYQQQQQGGYYQQQQQQQGGYYQQQPQQGGGYYQGR